MKHSCTAILGVSILTLVVSVANAANGEGAGLRSCQRYFDDLKKDPNTVDLYFSWGQGFMSGLNIARLNDATGGFESMPRQKQKEYLHNFCETNPTKNYFDGVMDLYSVLYPHAK